MVMTGRAAGRRRCDQPREGHARSGHRRRAGGVPVAAGRAADATSGSWSSPAYRGLVLLAGRYEGVDERLLEREVDLEFAVGDFVVSGGELPALLLIDAMVRQLPGRAERRRSRSVEESFVDGLLDCPHYTRPETVRRPARCRRCCCRAITRRSRAGGCKQSLGRTWLRRPDLLAAARHERSGRRGVARGIQARERK